MKSLEENELNELKEQEAKKSAIVNDLGILELKKHELLHAFAMIQADQERAKTELEAKYGKINIDLADGSFEPIVEELQHEEA